MISLRGPNEFHLLHTNGSDTAVCPSPSYRCMSARLDGGKPSPHCGSKLVMRATQPSFTISCKHPHPGVVSALFTYDKPYKRPRSPFQRPPAPLSFPNDRNVFQAPPPLLSFSRHAHASEMGLVCSSCRHVRAGLPNDKRATSVFKPPL